MEIDLDALEENLRDVSTIQLLVQDLLRARYFSAEKAMKTLAETYKDKEQIDLRFHPLAGNALSLAFGT